MRHRGLNPWPVRCGAGVPPLGMEDYYFAKLPLLDAVRWWWLVKNWKCRVRLALGGGGAIQVERTVILERVLELSELTRGQATELAFAGALDLQAGSYCTVTVIIGSADPLRVGGQRERAYWNGRHAVRRAGLAVPGELIPGVLVQVEGFFDLGSEFSVFLTNMTEPQARFAGSMGGYKFRLGRAEGDYDTDGASVTIEAGEHWTYSNGVLTPVYTVAGEALIDPLYAPVP